ncbi:MAG: DUF6879 family protein [Pseudonocardiales bacterium]
MCYGPLSPERVDPLPWTRAVRQEAEEYVLQSLREDFWLVDSATAVRMIYDEEGKFTPGACSDDHAPVLPRR